MKRSAAILAMALTACGAGGDTGNIDDTIVPEPADAGVAPTPTPDAMPAADPCEGAEAIIGTGNREFIPVEDGDTVYLFSGPQGGYMIYLGVRAKGLDPTDVTVWYQESFQSDGKVFGEGQWKVALPNDLGDGWHERVGIWGQIAPEYWPRGNSAVRGHDVEVKVKLTDSNGCTLDNLGWKVHINPDKPM